VNDVHVTLAHKPNQHAEDLQGWPPPIERDLHVLQPHAADALHQRTWFRNDDDHFMPAVAHRSGQPRR
jgi:hypothetical protein